MSEEEKEAIDKLKRSANYFVMPIYETTIILNLIEKQQKEIENLKELMAHKNGYTKQLEEDLFENASNYVVSKDKIREKIKELDEKWHVLYRDSEVKDILKELLEEE